MWSEFFASLPLSTLVVLWLGGFLGGFAAGAAGFAFGIVGSAIWLQVIEPLHATFLVAAGGLVIQTGTIWPLRHSIDRRRLGPLLLAGAVGVPIGVWFLVRSDVHSLKLAIGVFLGLYGVYALLAPRLPHIEAGRAADALIGLIGGILGGLGGYSGVLPAIWAQLRGWPKDTARSFYQPFIVMAHIITIVLIGVVALDRKGLVMFVVTLPMLGLGAWTGWNVYGRLNDRRFRQMFAVLLIVSSLALVL